MLAKVIGLDIAKHVFQVHGVNCDCGSAVSSTSCFRR